MSPADLANEAARDRALMQFAAEPNPNKRRRLWALIAELTANRSAEYVRELERARGIETTGE